MRYIWLKILVLLMAGCAVQASDDANISSIGGKQPSEQISFAQSDLENHNLASARSRFQSALSQDASDGNASAGLGVVELLLLPYDETVTDIIVSDLGGDGALNETKDVLYAESGILFFLARGAPWEDEGSFTGIRTIIEPDLPWDLDTIDSATSFFDDLGGPLNETMDRVARVADRLGEIQGRFEVALDDPEYRSLVIPGQTFHHDSLSLDLTKPDLAFMHFSIGVVRSGIYFVTAYDFDFSPSDIFGSRWSRIELDPEDPEHEPGFSYEDYVIRFISTQTGRSIRDGARLAKAGEELKRSIRSFRNAISLAAESFGAGTLGWQGTESEAAAATDRLFGALESSIDGSSVIPDTDPTLTLDLSGFFGDGKTLDDGVNWFERVTVEDEFGTYVTWEITEGASDLLFADVVSPDDSEINYTPAEGLAEYFEAVLGSFSQNIDDVYTSSF